MKCLFMRTLPIVAVLIRSTWAAPTDGHDDGLKIVKTTVSSNGQVIDWVVAESQGKMARPPPLPPRAGRGGQRMDIEGLMPEAAAMKGPEGTVPMLRSGPRTLPVKRLPRPEDDGSGGNETHASASYAGRHWYASSGQPVANLGGQATFSLYKAYVESASDFSLLQTAVIRTNAAHAGSGPVTQTVEAGWINYPGQVQPPHLFSYFTTNGYSSEGDDIGGWNREHAGWVQVDGLVYPGVAVAPLSTDGGAQYEMDVGFLLYEGNWWLWALGRYIGYYPGSLFSRGVDGGATLGGGADMINFYGEIFNSGPQMTTTDMGSGEFPEAGPGRAAYMRNVAYVDAGGAARDYNGSAQIVVSDAARYRLRPSFASGGAWGSFLYLGGPGAGGVVGG